MQSCSDEVLVLYEPLLTEYQQALETANPRANVAEATLSFHRHLQRLIENKWIEESHSLATLKTESNATIEEWWKCILEEELSDDQNAPSKGVESSAVPKDEERVPKQLLGVGRATPPRTPKQKPATDKQRRSQGQCKFSQEKGSGDEQRREESPRHSQFEKAGERHGRKSCQ
jgi:hypothetical protein